MAANDGVEGASLCRGVRAWKQNASGRSYYYYSGGTPVFETDPTGTVTAINVFAPDGLVARQSGGTWTHYVFDQQGNVAQRLDSSGNVLASPVFDSYGAGSTGGDVFGYNAQSGYLFDSETGLYCCQNRYFDPNVGRWLTRDPIGFGGGMNVYEYAGGAPVGATDPSGLQAEQVPAPVVPRPPLYIIQGTGRTAPWWMRLVPGALKGLGVVGLILTPERLGDDMMPGFGTRCMNPIPNGSPLGSPQSPAPGFVWRGSGHPGTSAGSWVNPATGETLRADFSHEDEPHWDYTDPDGFKWRIDPKTGKKIPNTRRGKQKKGKAKGPRE